jgi:RHS repeat-associated protein
VPGNPGLNYISKGGKMYATLKASRFFAFWARLLVVCMVLQGMPLMQLAQSYEWRFESQKIQWFFDLIGPTEAQAAPPQVVCVPQLPTDLLVPHETWSGEPTILKGIARDPDGNLTGGSYYWDLGDGTSTPVSTIGNADNLSVTHTYTADSGTVVVARLHVTDAAGESSSDDYRILIKDRNLDVEVNKAIDDGLWWLYTSKEVVGANFRWNNVRYGSHYGNSTASAVQAYEINGHLEAGDPDEDPYVDVVRGGIDYLLTQMYYYNIGPQTYGDPDSNGNGIGLTINSGYQIYELGAVMDAFVATGTRDALARVGGANVIGRRYQDLVQDMVDMYAWGQYDHATVGGGWRYSWNQAPDNSAAQWGAIGMLAAERHFGCTVPQWVKERNNVWLNYSYNAAGYFGYTSRSPNRALSTGPSGMVQLSFDGYDTSDSRWQACETYIDSHWAEFISTSRDCRYYSYYAFAKAMRLANSLEVTHLPSGLDWYGDETRGLARILVDRQNADGSWAYDGWPYVGERTAAAWCVIILTRTLFEKPPVAVAHAEPNPGAVGQQIMLDASDSYHVDPAKTITEYLWDFDASDGVDFTNPDAVGISAAATYGALGDYTVSLMVVDDSTPERFDTTAITVRITIPPHPPTAVMGGPYLAVVGETVAVDGSGSYDVDEPEGDLITAWEWEVDFIAPYDFDEAVGETALLDGYGTAGTYDIALRVTDNTSVVFPQSGSPDLTNTAYGRVRVYREGVNDLAARPKATKCQLTWAHVGVDQYEVLRSDLGPNHGYVLIGTTGSTYSTFIDFNVEMYQDYWYRIRYVDTNETFLSGPVHINSAGRIRNLPPEITSTPVTAAEEAQPYSYDVDAVDPEGSALTYYLDQAPDGMSIDAASGLINWTPAFDQVGLADVTVRVNDTLSASAAQFFQILVAPRPNSAPIAETGGPYSGMINTAVAFDASASTDPEGDPMPLYHWVFGDGSEGYGQQTEHIYTAAGTYTVSLYVTDDRGATGQAETVCQIEAPNRPPTAVIAGAAEGESGVPIVFNAFSSTDPDNDPLTFTWNFGDSTPAETGETVVHSFAAEGSYMVSVTADDGRGGLDTAELEVVIAPLNQPPVAAFTVTGDQTRLQTLTFDASGSFDPEGQPLVSYDWDFGDGVTTTGQIVTHVYESVGTFAVTLTVEDDKGALGTAQQQAVIAEIMVQVPGVTGLSQAEAVAAIDAAELVVGTVTPQTSETVPAGAIIAQDPEAGTSVAINSVVNIVVSLGPPMVIVPAVTGLEQSAAEVAILGADLTVGIIQSQTSDSVPEGDVISQNPASGTSVVIHSSVDLVVSIGAHQLITVPDVIGLPSAEAQGIIAVSGLAVGTLSQQYSGTVPAGNVISSDPVSGTLVVDTTPVNLVISLGVQLVTVPEVVGRDQSEATTLITAAGLTVGSVVQEMNLGVPEGQVLAQNPAGGASVPIASTVDLTVAVHSDTILPQVGVSLSANPVGPYGYTLITVSATDNIGVTQTTLSVDGVTLSLNSANQCWYLAGSEGAVEVIAQAYDAAGNMGSATVQLIVSAASDSNPPTVTLSYSPAAPTVGDAITFDISATDDAGVDLERIWLKVDGIYLPVVNGQAVYTANRQGNIPAIASAYDLSGNYAQDTVLIPVVIAGSDTQAPVAEITSPVDDAEVLGDLQVTGTADDPNMAYYTLNYRAEGESAFVEYFRSESPVVDGPLGPFDATHLENGLYTLRLMVVDQYGNAVVDDVRIMVSGEQKIGNFTLSFSDMHLKLSGVDIEVIRTYDSRVKSSRDFGVGWSLGVKQGIRLFENVAPGVGWKTYCKRTLFGTCLEWGIQADRAHDVTIQIPGARKQEFEAKVVVTYADSSGLAQGYIRFDPKAGTYSTLEPLDNVTFDFLMGNQLLDWDFELINPNRYRLTLLDGTRYDYNQDTGSVYRIVDANGNTMDIAADGITHSDGAQVQFNRDAYNRITSIEDNDGRSVIYTYDDLGNLTSVTDPNGNTTRFKYAANHYLDEVIDPLGMRAVRTEYDENGRMIRQINADGDEVAFDHDVDNQTETVTDFAGYQTIFEYNDLGQVTSKTDTLGNTWAYEHDARGNETQVTNPDGTVRLATYDPQDNRTSETDELGNQTVFSFDSHGNMTSMTDAEGRYSQYQYDSGGNLIRQTGPDGNVDFERTYDGRGNVLTETDALGNVTAYTYDGHGNKLTETDPLGNVTAYTYDGRGNMLTRTDAAGNVTTYTYDDNDNRLNETDPLGNTAVYTYTSFNKVLTKTDKAGRLTEYVYDIFGQHIRTIFPDGSVETKAYDVNGSLTGKTDAAGRVTQSTYDGEKRLLSTVTADGSEVNYTYDSRGRKTAMIDALGNRTEYEYDAVGNNILVRDALGNETAYEYDAVGNQVAMVDAAGNRTEFDYDDNNRQTAIHYPDGTVSSTVYDAMGRKIGETDQAGNTTTYEYDALGRLIRVIDALGNTTAFGYDALGNKISQTDPNGHVTSWDYDALNRVVRHTLPSGQQEQFAYDANGNRISHMDFNGDTTVFGYDAKDRLILKTYADDSEVAFTYTPAGQKETATDARGTTRYLYDARDRLLEVDQPDGTAVTYTYDANGNRTSVATASGSTAYAFDELNRLHTVTDSAGGVTTYAYDAAGNRASVTYPNGIVTTYTYDSLQRLTALENETSTGTVVSGYTYTLGPAGNRLSVTEHSGRVVDYTYDALYRLVEEAISDSVAGDETVGYTYDGFGNRLTKTDSSGAVAYTYDVNDRLISESGPAGILNYTYDANGNRLSKADGVTTTDYFYDFENRLISAQTGSSTTTYAYDEDGIRISSSADGVLTRYVLDKNRRYAQVLEERDGTGALVIGYVHGDDLISQVRGSAVRYYLYDGQMSTRQLIDASEAVTDEYTFDAYGVILDQTGATINNFLYTGEQYDPNVGFYYLRARYYDQSNGQFLSADTWQGSIYDPMSLHKYLYAQANPIINVDFSGRMSACLSSMMVAMSVNVILTSIQIVYEAAWKKRIIPGWEIFERLGVAAAVGALGGAVAFRVGMAVKALGPFIQGAFGGAAGSGTTQFIMEIVDFVGRGKPTTFEDARNRVFRATFGGLILGGIVAQITHIATRPTAWQIVNVHPQYGWMEAIPLSRAALSTGAAIVGLSELFANWINSQFTNWW